MRPVARRLLPPFACSLLVWACGGAPKPIASIAPATSASASASAGLAPLPKPISPAHWVLSATGTTHQNARIDLATIGAGKGTLYVGDAGERWLEPDDGRAMPVAAATLAADSLIGAVPRVGGGLTFVGRTGATFDAESPLGALSVRGASPGVVGSIAIGSKSIVAVLMPKSPATPADVASLARSVDGGKTWARFPGDPSFPKESQPTRVAMLASGVGVALFHPQRAMVTLDDGASWNAIATLPVGARNVVADGNGELVVEGFESSAVLRATPTPHFEKVARSSRQGVDLSLGADASEESLSEAIASGRGALVGARYVHVQAERDDSTRWTVAIGPLGERATAKRIPELDRCNAVYVGGSREDGRVVELACDRTPGESRPMPRAGYGGYGGYGYGGEDYGMSASVRLELFKSEDGGKTFKADGVAGASYRDVRSIWVSPTGTTIVEGACKRMRTPDYICGESTAIVRPAGATAFAKVGGLHSGSVLVDVAFSRDGTRAYAIERDAETRLRLLVSRDGGLDFVRKPLPAQEDPTRAGGLVRAQGTWGRVGIDETPGAQRLVIAVAADNARAMVFSSDDAGETIAPRRLPFEPDLVEVGGAHAFAFDVDGRAWESGDAGETWSHAGASKLLGAEGQATTCDAYGCVFGARMTRVGWDHDGKGEVPIPAPPVAPKLVASPTIECDAGGEWRPVPGAYGLPQINNVDLAPTDRWVFAKRDLGKGAIVAIVGTQSAKGLEIKEIPLFDAPADPLHYASNVSLQSLGVAALRYVVRREESVASASGGATMATSRMKRPPPPPPAPSRKIVDGQIVDVELAWYVAATGKVHRATIKGAGTLDTRSDVSDYGGNAPTAYIGALQITEGGLHVRPLASVGANVTMGAGSAARRSDGPLFFVSDAGKVERLDWPDLPAHDNAGRTLNPDVDVARAGGRSIVTAVVGGRELFAAFSPSGTGATRDAGWTSATWGLYPDQATAADALRLRIVDFGGKPAAALMIPTGAFAEQTIGLSLDAPTPEPQTLGRWPAQGDFAESIVGCGATATARMIAPTSVGHRRAVLVRGNGTDGLFATSNASLRMVPTSGASGACVGVFEAPAVAPKSSSPTPSYRPGYSAARSGSYPSTTETFTTFLWPDRAGATDKLQGSLFRWAASSSALYERPLACAVTATPAPDELRTTYGFTR